MSTQSGYNSAFMYTRFEEHFFAACSHLRIQIGRFNGIHGAVVQYQGQAVRAMYSIDYQLLDGRAKQVTREP